MTGPAEALPPVEESAGELRGEGGVRLHFRAWSPHRPRAALLIVHGLGEHSGRYASPAVALARRGIRVYALDLRGHGRSAGQRGHAGRFAELLSDVHALRLHAHAATAGALPVLLFGHSLGGLVAARYLQTHADPPLRAAVLSAPALGLGPDVPRWQRVLARRLSRLVPRLPSPNGLDPDNLSHDPAEVAAYRADPLVHRRITPRLFTEMEGAMRAAFAERERIRLPLRVLVPEADRIVSPPAALAFCAGTPFEVRRYPGLFHEPLHEVQREAVLRELIGWFEAQIG